MSPWAAARLSERARAIARHCVMGDVDEDALLEMLRQAAEVDWDAGHDCGLDDSATDDAHVIALNPWRLP